MPLDQVVGDMDDTAPGDGPIAAVHVVVCGDVEVRVLCHDGHVAAALRGVRGPAAVEQRGRREVVAI